jgi:hypothetical protein
MSGASITRACVSTDHIGWHASPDPVTRGPETNGHPAGCKQTGGLTVALQTSAAFSQVEHAGERCWQLPQLQH